MNIYKILCGGVLIVGYYGYKEGWWGKGVEALPELFIMMAVFGLIFFIAYKTGNVMTEEQINEEGEKGLKEDMEKLKKEIREGK